MLKYVTPSWGNPTPYSKTLDKMNINVIYLNDLSFRDISYI